MEYLYVLYNMYGAVKSIAELDFGLSVHNHCGQRAHERIEHNE